MGQTERLFKIRQWLSAGRCVRKADLLRELEVSESTLKRDMAQFRDRLNMPVQWDTEQAGWHLPSPAATAPGTQMELPGLWLSAEEIHALLTMQHLLANLDAGGLLADQIEPLRQRLAHMLGSGVPPKAEVARRIRVQTVGARRLHLPHFQAIGASLLRRRRLHLRYLGRSQGSGHATERELSPQRLVHYRDNWYLDAWCHLRQALRSFSLDAVQTVQVLAQPAIDVPDAELNEALGAGYGIFAGRSVQQAILRFSPDRARWVAAERWHPDQLGRWDSQGHWLLTVPYADPRELVMDILRHVPEVEVLGPDELQAEVLRRLEAGVRRMRGVDG